MDSKSTSIIIKFPLVEKFEIFLSIPILFGYF